MGFPDSAWRMLKGKISGEQRARPNELARGVADGLEPIGYLALIDR